MYPTTTFVYTRLLLAAFVLIFTAAPAKADKADKLWDRVLFDDDKLLQVELTLPAEDWQQLRTQRRSFSTSFTKQVPESPYTYFRADLRINGVTIKNVGVRKKGFFGSMDDRRPSLKIKLREFEDNDKLGGQTHLTLNNNKQDRSHASQILSYHLFRKAGLPAPRVSLAHVTVNGESLGIYGHVESIKKAFLKREFGSAKGDLYEGTFPTDFLPGWTTRFEIKTDDTKDLRDIEAITALLDREDPNSINQLGKLIDLELFVRHWALESIIGFWDGYGGNQNNYFLYKRPKDQKLQFIPWGADFAFSNQFQFGGPNSVKAKGILAYRLNQIPEFRERYDQVQRELLDKVWNEEELVAMAERAGELAARSLHNDQAGLEQATAQLKSFVTQRKRVLLEEIKDGPLHVTTPPGKPMYFKQVGKVAATFSTRWGASAEAEVDGNVLTLTVDGKPETIKTLRVTAESARVPGFGPPGPPMASLVFQGQQGEQPMRLTVMLDVNSFRPSEKEVKVQGMLTEGESSGFGRGFGRGKTIAGRIKFEAAGQTDNAPVVGKLTGHLLEMQGGFGGPPQETRRARRPDPDAPQRRARVRRAVSLFRELDQNKNGQLEASEWKDAEEDLTEADSDGNQSISLRELSDWLKSNPGE